ncbi:MAG: C-terminal binding protein [Spirochaetales bacterium]|nr:C-terminal binding protein [Spirochaetales bacterium]
MVHADTSGRTHKPLVVITDERHGRVTEEEAVFGPLGAELRVASCSSSEDVAAACADADAVLVNLAPVDAKAIAAMTRCKAICRYGVGMDNVDQEAAAAKGISVLPVRGYCDEEVAGHALALMMALARGLAGRDRAVKNGGWNLDGPQSSPAGAVIGVAGFGGTGRAFARMALALAPERVLVWSPHLDPARVDRELGAAAAALGTPIQAAGLDELAASSDFLSVHLALSEETRGLFGQKVLARMKRGAFLVNTSRGGLIDEAALLAALDSGHLAGAGLDVFSREPPGPGHVLATHPKVIASDHCAYRSTRSLSELKTRCALNAARALGLAT